MPESQTPEQKVKSLEFATTINRGAYGPDELQRLEDELAFLKGESESGSSFTAFVHGAKFDPSP